MRIVSGSKACWRATAFRKEGSTRCPERVGHIGHIGLYRDPKTRVAVAYYFKMFKMCKQSVDIFCVAVQQFAHLNFGAAFVDSASLCSDKKRALVAAAHSAP